ncbi:transposase [Streptomyces brevispora]|uniref:Transposase n=1 Tax=Streptomyces brevispora TaxID=887462 RepID=A0ABZ1G919_9ACTN|nr:transposase [Streptomyces brevispora]WSC15650.1 transposase [Streptomyces brevispora]
MARPSRYPLELRRRAVRMFAEVRGDYPTETAALQSVAEKLDIGSRETLRNWVKQHEIDAGQRPGTTTEESAQLKALKKENAELKRPNDILKAAASFLTAALHVIHLHPFVRFPSKAAGHNRNTEQVRVPLLTLIDQGLACENGSALLHVPLLGNIAGTRERPRSETGAFPVRRDPAGGVAA